MTSLTKPPIWFWIIAVIALLWNLTGVSNYLTQVLGSPEILEAMPEHQREYIEKTPSWVTACFATAVWGGFFGCVLLLIRKKLAYLLFIVSLIGIIGQVSHSLIISSAIEVYGPSGLIIPILIVIIGIGLVIFTKKSIRNNWLN